MQKLFVCFALIISGSLFVPLSFADLPSTAGQTGRLKDGRAYRVDQNGYKLVDHIAELEVTVDDLNRQVRALEDELSDKQRQITSLRNSNGESSSSSVQEADLINPSEARGFSTRATAIQCERFTAPLNAEIGKLELALQAKPREVSASAPVCDYDAAKKPLREQIARLQTALMKNPSAESYQQQVAKRQRLESSVSELEQARANELQTLESQKAQVVALNQKVEQNEESLRDVGNTLKRTSKREKKLKREVTQLTAEIEKLRSSQQLASAKVPAAQVSTSRASYRKPADSRRQAKVLPVIDNRTLARAKKEYRVKLGSIQSLIGKRKSLLDSVKSSGKGISIKISSLKTRDGRSLDTVRRQVSKLGQSSDLKAIRVGLVEIERVLKDDIALLKRLAK